jgi:hypothetical protein
MTITDKQSFDLMRAYAEKPPETLEDFELWLLHRSHRPNEYADAEDCGKAWHLTKDYRASLWSKGGK